MRPIEGSLEQPSDIDELWPDEVALGAMLRSHYRRHPSPEVMAAHLLELHQAAEVERAEITGDRFSRTVLLTSVAACLLVAAFVLVGPLRERTTATDDGGINTPAASINSLSVVEAPGPESGGDGQDLNTTPATSLFGSESDSIELRFRDGTELGRNTKRRYSSPGRGLPAPDAGASIDYCHHSYCDHGGDRTADLGAYHIDTRRPGEHSASYNSPTYNSTAFDGTAYDARTDGYLSINNTPDDHPVDNEPTNDGPLDHPVDNEPTNDGPFDHRRHDDNSAGRVPRSDYPDPLLIAEAAVPSGATRT